jgi:hypothetical protein
MGYGPWDRLDWNVFLLLDLGLRDDLVFMNYTQALLSFRPLNLFFHIGIHTRLTIGISVQNMIIVYVDRLSV